MTRRLYLECHRRAPHAAPAFGSAGPIWPLVHQELWCGEYEPREGERHGQERQGIGRPDALGLG
ncbi:MAG: hypothetical protein AB7Q29_19260 [Vicinamibacterales bacterium]